MKKNVYLYGVLLLILLNCWACQSQNKKATQSFNYPKTAKIDQIDNYHGIEVKDPYRWLENSDSPEVKDWIARQNEFTAGYFAKIPFRQEILKRFQTLYNYQRYSTPFIVGDYYIFAKNDGLQNQSVYYIQKGLTGTAEVFIDPNTLSQDGTIRVSLLESSKDNKYITLSYSEAGSDWREIRIMEIESKTELPDRLKWVKFSGTSWHENGFYYSRYDKPRPGAELSQKNSVQKIYFHTLGDNQKNDRLVYSDPAHPLQYIYASVSADNNYLLLSISQGLGNEVRYRLLSDPKGEFKTICHGFDYDNYVIHTHQGKLIIYTNHLAPTYKVIRIDPLKPEKDNWSELIKEENNVLESVSFAGGKLFCHYLENGGNHVYRYALNGDCEGEISLPELGSANGFYGKENCNETFYSFSSFTYPTTIFHYSITEKSSKLFQRVQISFDPTAYETRQVTYESKDKTLIPMFLILKKGLKPEIPRPLYLYGYGGFNQRFSMSFNPGYIPLLEQGGIYALPTLRGGGDFGDDWHRAGMLEKKQNVFDDFIAAAEYLIREKYTNRDLLAIAGGSNGGLLVGACLTQRPELFKVALPAVGVMDMLRFHKFTVGWGWITEYGSSENAEQFNYLYAYSPLHNIKNGTAYPATLITTADHDDRVIPAHSYKFAAALQAAQKGDNPVLIDIDTRSGHGSSSFSKALEKSADSIAFMLYNMNIPYQPIK